MPQLEVNYTCDHPGCPSEIIYHSSTPLRHVDMLLVDIARAIGWKVVGTGKRLAITGEPVRRGQTTMFCPGCRKAHE